MDGSELHSVFDGTVPSVLMVLIEITLVVCFLLGSALNTILLLVYIRRRGFRSQISNKFLLNLVFSNLLWNLVLIPILLFDNAISTLEDPEFRSKVAYTVFQFFLIFGTCASLLSQLLIGTDQYLAVVDPLHYNTRVNTKRCYFMCGAVWGLSFMVATLNVINYEELGVVVSNIPIVFNTWPSPSQAPSVSTSVFTSSFAVMLFLVPFGVLTFMYSKIFGAAHKNTMRTRHNSINSVAYAGLQRTSTTGLSPYYGFPGQSSNYLGVTRSHSVKSAGGLRSSFKHSMCHTFSNAGNLFQYREDRRAAKATLLVLVMIFVCWTPFFGLISYYADITTVPNHLSPCIKGFATLLVASSSVLSPILYAYRSRRVQRDVKRVLGLTAYFKERKRLRTERKQLQKMKSFSCPQLHVSHEADFPMQSHRMRKNNLLSKPPQTSDQMQSFMKSAHELVPMISHEGRCSFSSGSSSGNTTSTHITFYVGNANEDQSDVIL
ncbi:probable G-protein coupled receptor No18 [Tigriopus californicus]|uniref:probable G-protein coupled receptor No18 n=1 Tax=Tigriopus californicus TaxID=6832 RepID=UPI0027DA5333|nr:probable G-protein coupled receptor No18 [Tigriopus californicus]XP_059090787.1 probable G-protein coupled receptor No18 [Tigriopus californicus]XP_059090788.1 probable G-protein coupled receptor No18 [Tigriopus californicus]XP_059090789.1 probable G-protein coupled receptor No18 [Tigriopus californicus]